MVGDVALLVPHAPLDGRLAEGVADRLAQRLGAVDHEQDALLGVEAALDQVGQLGVSSESMRIWGKQGAINAGEAKWLTSGERAELRELRRKMRVLVRSGRSEKAAAFFARESEDAVRCFRFIAAEKANYPISLLCRLLGVSRSSFRRAPSDRELADAWLVGPIGEGLRLSMQVSPMRRGPGSGRSSPRRSERRRVATMATLTVRSGSERFARIRENPCKLAVSANGRHRARTFAH